MGELIWEGFLGIISQLDSPVHNIGLCLSLSLSLFSVPWSICVTFYTFWAYSLFLKGTAFFIGEAERWNLKNKIEGNKRMNKYAPYFQPPWRFNLYPWIRYPHLYFSVSLSFSVLFFIFFFFFIILFLYRTDQDYPSYNYRN